MVEAKEVSKLPVKNSNTDINKLLFRVMESVL